MTPAYLSQKAPGKQEGAWGDEDLLVTAQVDPLPAVRPCEMLNKYWIQSPGGTYCYDPSFMDAETGTKRLTIAVRGLMVQDSNPDPEVAVCVGGRGVDWARCYTVSTADRPVAWGDLLNRQGTAGEAPGGCPVPGYITC